MPLVTDQTPTAFAERKPKALLKVKVKVPTQSQFTRGRRIEFTDFALQGANYLNQSVQPYRHTMSARFQPRGGYTYQPGEHGSELQTTTKLVDKSQKHRSRYQHGRPALSVSEWVGGCHRRIAA